MEQEGGSFFKEKLIPYLTNLTNDSQRKIMALCTIIALPIMAYLAGYLIAFSEDGLAAIGRPFWEYILKGFLNPKGLVMIAGLVIPFLFFLDYIIRKKGGLDNIKYSDKRGVDYSEKGTYGTAEPMSEAEAATVYEIGSIESVRGVILAQYEDDGKKVICLPEDTQRNRNIVVLGSPGTGKSYCYVRNAIFQAMVRKESIVITDPKGELYESTAAKLKEEGYKVYVYNLSPDGIKRSDSWNCLSEIYDPETGDINDPRVNDFADIIMKNTTDGPDDHFWGTGESNLFKAIIFFSAWRREVHIQTMFEFEGKGLAAAIKDQLTEESKQKLLDILSIGNEDTTMKERERAIKLLYKAANPDLILNIEDLDRASENLVTRIKRGAPPCEMAAIYHLLVTVDINEHEANFAKVPISHPAAISWSVFKKGADNVKPGFVQGLSQRLQLFQMRDIRRITTNDDIILEKIGEEKSVLFCIISDKTTSMRSLTSLFFTFLFKDLSDAADRDGPENRLYVNVICDEFANLGTIPQFDTNISTLRSRKVNLSIILQSVMQLDKNYAEARDTILGCCDTLLFLGCNDEKTATYISDLSGIASIRVISTKDSRSTSLGNRGIMQGYQVGEGDGKRNILNPDEVRRMPRGEVIVYHSGCNILQAKRCGFTQHPYFLKGLPPPVRLKNYPLAKDKYQDTEYLDAFVQGDIHEMKRRNQAIVADESISKSIRSASSTSSAATITKLTEINSDKNSFDF